MKNSFYIFLFPLLAMLASCGKGSAPQPAGPVTGTVTINGTNYPTVTIGNQVWTTQNYSGAGGGEVNTTTGDASLNGNYYTTPTNITLPTGWRIPTRADYNKLLNNYSTVVNTSGDTQCDLTATQGLLSTAGWQGISGTNKTGFNAYSAGYISKQNGNYSTSGKTQEAYYLTSDEYTMSSDGFTFFGGYYVLQLGANPTTYNNTSYYGFVTAPADLLQYNGYSLRFVKDNN